MIRTLSVCYAPALLRHVGVGLRTRRHISAVLGNHDHDSILGIVSKLIIDSPV